MAMDHSPGKQFNTMAGAGGNTERGLSIGGPPNASRGTGAHANVAQPPSKRQSSKPSLTRARRNKKPNSALGAPRGGVAAAKNAHYSAPAGGATGPKSAAAGGDPPPLNENRKRQPRECDSRSLKSTGEDGPGKTKSGKHPLKNAVLSTSDTGTGPAGPSLGFVLAGSTTGISTAFASSPSHSSPQRERRTSKSSARRALLPALDGGHQPPVQLTLSANPTLLDQLEALPDFSDVQKIVQSGEALNAYMTPHYEHNILTQLQALPPIPPGKPAQQLVPLKQNTYVEDWLTRHKQKISSSLKGTRRDGAASSRAARTAVSNGTHHGQAANRNDGSIHLPTKLHELMHNEDGMVVHSKSGESVIGLQSTMHVHDGKSFRAFTVPYGRGADVAIKLWDLQLKEGEKMAALRTRASKKLGNAFIDYFHRIEQTREGFGGKTVKHVLFWHPLYDGTLESARGITLREERQEQIRQAQKRAKARAQREEDADSDGSDSEAEVRKPKAKKKRG